MHGMWIASPSSSSKDYVLNNYDGIGCCFYPGLVIGDRGVSFAYCFGLKPIVCLKSGTKLQVNGDGYKIVP